METKETGIPEGKPRKTAAVAAPRFLDDRNVGDVPVSYEEINEKLDSILALLRGKEEM
jgi:hypothetical protein